MRVSMLEGFYRTRYPLIYSRSGAVDFAECVVLYTSRRSGFFV